MTVLRPSFSSGLLHSGNISTAVRTPREGTSWVRRASNASSKARMIDSASASKLSVTMRPVVVLFTVATGTEDSKSRKDTAAGWSWWCEVIVGWDGVTPARVGAVTADVVAVTVAVGVGGAVTGVSGGVDTG